MARVIVRWASAWWQLAYQYNEQYPSDARRYVRRAKLIERFFFPVARRLDRRAMSEQMAEECWWG